MRIAALILINVALIITLNGQVGASVWDGVYTLDQAKRGETIYLQKCASCHGDALEGGGQAPELVGDEFKGNWNGQTVGDLFDKLQDTMPGDSPGSLSRPQNADILAYLLKFNDFPAGGQELHPGAELKKIRFEASKTKN